MKAEDFDLSRTQWENIIDEWIFNEEDRKMLKRRLLDGVTMERLAEEFNYSTQYTYKRVERASRKLFSHVVIKKS